MKETEELSEKVSVERSLHALMTIVVLAVNFLSMLVTAGLFLLFYLLGLLPIGLFATLWMPFLPLLAGSIIGTLVSGIVYRKVLRPLDDLSKAMQKVSEGDFSVRLPIPHSFRQIVSLTERFNRMAEELQSTEILKTDFVSTFSHEFKTPIVSIRGFARQLTKKNLDEDARLEYAGIILSESERLSRMSENVLLLSRVEHQQVITERVPYRLDEQLRSCILLLEKSWSRKNIEWNPETEEIEIVSNPQIIEHIWLNLFGNAIKFSPEGSTVDVHAVKKDGFAVVSVKDRGIGMEQKTVDRIFEKFYQGDSSHAQEGNGLGLSIVYRIVQLAQGKIEIFSEVGRGTEFRVSLPLDVSRPEAK